MIVIFVLLVGSPLSQSALVVFFSKPGFLWMGNQKSIFSMYILFYIELFHILLLNSVDNFVYQEDLGFTSDMSSKQIKAWIENKDFAHFLENRQHDRKYETYHKQKHINLYYTNSFKNIEKNVSIGIKRNLTQSINYGKNKFEKLSNRCFSFLLDSGEKERGVFYLAWNKFKVSRWQIRSLVLGKKDNALYTKTNELYNKREYIKMQHSHMHEVEYSKTELYPMHAC